VNERESLKLALTNFQGVCSRNMKILDEILNGQGEADRLCALAFDSSVSPREASRDIKFVFPKSVDSELSREDQTLLCGISANSAALVELIGQLSESEMLRTRHLDETLEKFETHASDQIKHLSEIGALKDQLQSIREVYDAELIEDFRLLTDLIQVTENLELEVQRERRGQRRQVDSRKLKLSDERAWVIAPVKQSTIQLQEEVKALAEEFTERDQRFKSELEDLHRELSRIKSKKIKYKSAFQQSLRSIFKDLDVLVERLDRSELTLEKIHVHYKIDEQEILSIVSPIIETIDDVRSRVLDLASEADEVFYGKQR
jgi:hypothetical protein